MFREVLGSRFWVLVVILLIPAPALAFSSLLLFDPAFIQFAFLEVPIVSSLLMAILETLAVGFLVKPPAFSFGSYYGKMLTANLSAMVINIFLIVFLVFVVTGVFADPGHDAVIWIGVGYFALMFAYIGWHKKCKYSEAIIEDEEYKQKSKKLLFVVNAISYSCLYTFLYFSLF